MTTTLGSQAVQDVYKTALVVVAAFRSDPVRDALHPAQVAALDDLEASCRFVYELTAGEAGQDSESEAR